MRRIRITVSYDGTGFHGWQVQPGLPTIQQALETVLGEIEGVPVSVAGSGTHRTRACTRSHRWPLRSRLPIPSRPRKLPES